MKKLLSIFMFVLLTNAVASQVIKTINISSAGALSSSLSSTEKTTITSLTVTGTLDARDFQCMRDELTVLADVDLSGINVAAYNGTGTYSSKNAANQLPVCSFYSMSTDYRKVSLRSVTLPTTITAIGMLSFYGCSNLEKVVCMINTPPSAKDMVFTGISPTIYIPYGKTAAYKAVTEWKDFNFVEVGNISNTENISTNNTINVYPNPVKNDLKIDFEGGSIFEIQNISGQTVHTGNLTKSSVIQTSNFPAGIYIIKFPTGKTFEYKKFIKE